MKLMDIVKNSFVATIYVVLTVVIVPYFSFGALQFRISEVLLILVLFNKKYWVGLIIGTFISNLFSPLGIIDWIVGTSASAISIYLMLKFKHNLWLSLLMPVIVNGILVGIELNIVFETPLLMTILSVGFGQFVVVTLAGGLLYKLLENNKAFKQILD